MVAGRPAADSLRLVLPGNRRHVQLARLLCGGLSAPHGPRAPRPEHARLAVGPELVRCSRSGTVDGGSCY